MPPHTVPGATVHPLPLGIQWNKPGSSSSSSPPSSPLTLPLGSSEGTTRLPAPPGSATAPALEQAALLASTAAVNASSGAGHPPLVHVNQTSTYGVPAQLVPTATAHRGESGLDLKIQQPARTAVVGAAASAVSPLAGAASPAAGKTCRMGNGGTGDPGAASAVGGSGGAGADGSIGAIQANDAVAEANSVEAGAEVGDEATGDESSQQGQQSGESQSAATQPLPLSPSFSQNYLNALSRGMLAEAGFQPVPGGMVSRGASAPSPPPRLPPTPPVHAPVHGQKSSVQPLPPVSAWGKLPGFKMDDDDNTPKRTPATTAAAGPGVGIGGRHQVHRPYQHHYPAPQQQRPSQPKASPIEPRDAAAAAREAVVPRNQGVQGAPPTSAAATRPGRVATRGSRVVGTGDEHPSQVGATGAAGSTSTTSGWNAAGRSAAVGAVAAPPHVATPASMPVRVYSFRVFFFLWLSTGAAFIATSALLLRHVNCE